MKKILALVLALMLALTAASALAEPFGNGETLSFWRAGIPR